MACRHINRLFKIHAIREMCTDPLTILLHAIRCFHCRQPRSDIVVLAIIPDKKKTSSKQLCKKPFDPPLPSVSHSVEIMNEIFISFSLFIQLTVVISFLFSFCLGASARVTTTAIGYYASLFWHRYTTMGAGSVR